MRYGRDQFNDDFSKTASELLAEILRVRYAALDEVAVVSAGERLLVFFPARGATPLILRAAFGQGSARYDSFNGLVRRADNFLGYAPEQKESP